MVLTTYTYFIEQKKDNLALDMNFYHLNKVTHYLGVKIMSFGVVVRVIKLL